jgi:hypothetical protein
MQEPGTGVAQRGKIVVSGHTAILRHLCVIVSSRVWVIKHGLAVAVAADEVLLALDAIVADVSDLEPAPSTRR